MTKMLLIDNDYRTAAIVRDLLPGCEIRAVQLGDHGIQAATIHHHDVILTSTSLPDMGGEYVAEYLKGIGLETPIYAFSESDRDKDAFERSGCDGFIVTPFTKEALEGVLKRP